MKSKQVPAAALIASALAVAVLLYCSLAKPSSAHALKDQESLTLDVRKIQSRDEADLFGGGWRMSSRLHFVDAYALRNDHPQFGGWSGLTFDAQHQQLIAVSDTGHWMTFDPADLSQEDTASAQIRARAGPLLGDSGNPATGNGPRDIEAIALTANGTYLSYESPNSGIYFSNERNIESAKFLRQNKLTAEFAALPKGFGLESLTATNLAPAPLELLAIAERPIENQTRVEAWLIRSAKSQTRGHTAKPTGASAEINRLSLGNLDGYDVSDVAWSPACGLFGIQRKLTWYGRLKIKLVKLNISSDRTSMSSEELFSGHSGGSAIDNYEGLAVVDVAPGVCDLYAISDDNFLPVQKTILMRFRYKETA